MLQEALKPVMPGFSVVLNRVGMRFGGLWLDMSNAQRAVTVVEGCWPFCDAVACHCPFPRC